MFAILFEPTTTIINNPFINPFHSTPTGENNQAGNISFHIRPSNWCASVLARCYMLHGPKQNADSMAARTGSLNQNINYSCYYALRSASLPAPSLSFLFFKFTVSPI